MNEIHKNTGQLVYLDVYGGGADALPTAVFRAADGETTRDLTVTQDAPPSGIDDRYHVILTMADTQAEGEVSVTWNFEMEGVEIEKVDEFDIVTPYLSIGEVKSIWPSASDEEAINVEALVRHIINAHTGQSFGYSTKTLTVEAHGESALRLPERLIEITGMSTMTAVLNPNSAIIVSDGWYLKKGWSDEVTPIVTTNTYFGAADVGNELPGTPGYEKPGHGHIIHAPGAGPSPTPWRQDYPFKITGKWGYRTVPAPVKEAARLLIADFACNEVKYRDAYLESIKAADWRMQFSSRSWDYTGNVRADHLLAEYVLLDWAVI